MLCPFKPYSANTALSPALIGRLDRGQVAEGGDARCPGTSGVGVCVHS